LLRRHPYTSANAALAEQSRFILDECPLNHIPKGMYRRLADMIESDRGLEDTDTFGRSNNRLFRLEYLLAPLQAAWVSLLLSLVCARRLYGCDSKLQSLLIVLRRVVFCNRLFERPGLVPQPRFGKSC
jgi:hypothetical protein